MTEPRPWKPTDSQTQTVVRLLPRPLAACGIAAAQRGGSALVCPMRPPSTQPVEASGRGPAPGLQPVSFHRADGVARRGWAALNRLGPWCASASSLTRTCTCACAWPSTPPGAADQQPSVCYNRTVIGRTAGRRRPATSRSPWATTFRLANLPAGGQCTYSIIIPDATGGKPWQNIPRKEYLSNGYPLGTACTILPLDHAIITLHSRYADTHRVI